MKCLDLVRDNIGKVLICQDVKEWTILYNRLLVENITRFERLSEKFDPEMFEKYLATAREINRLEQLTEVKSIKLIYLSENICLN